MRRTKKTGLNLRKIFLDFRKQERHADSVFKKTGSEAKAAASFRIKKHR